MNNLLSISFAQGVLLTLAKIDVLPPSTGPTRSTFAGPPRLVVLLEPEVTVISHGPSGK
jgi:hypothetical protein